MVQRYLPSAAEWDGRYLAQLLWQRGIRQEEQLRGFLDCKAYQPTSPFAFGEPMKLAVHRLQLAMEGGEAVAIWGDFDTDGVTATSVLWEGLGEFFPPEKLTYFIPNRLQDSHGLHKAGLERLASSGYKLLVTCDTGNSNLGEIDYAAQLGMDVLVTDHHTLPDSPPAAVAVINPRSLPADHPLAHLSGVAVAYKLIEALYESFPHIPQQPLEYLLDLVAIGLIADLVKLTGDCRYLAQKGIEQLQADYHKTPDQRHRPGIGKLLDLCKRSGDRPTDISFGIGPRINSVSRIYGDASLCVELLTSRDVQRCSELAEKVELTNHRRQEMAERVAAQVRDKLAEIDLSTTCFIVLADESWSVGILGLVASQIAEAYGMPTLLLGIDGETAMGSARSVCEIDLYRLICDCSHLLTRWGGHPFAAGMSLPAANIPLLRETLNRKLRHLADKNENLGVPQVAADLKVSVEELGKNLFKELKCLEPYGMGNPVPRLLLENCRFVNPYDKSLQDKRTQRPMKYKKTEFKICNHRGDIGFSGVWWGHPKEDLPLGKAVDAIVELEANLAKKKYEVRLVDFRLRETPASVKMTNGDVPAILDFRQATEVPQGEEWVLVKQCPQSWDELSQWWQQAVRLQKPLALAYRCNEEVTATEIWQRLVGMAKYLSRTQKIVSEADLLAKLPIANYPLLQVGLRALTQLGWEVVQTPAGIQILGDGDFYNTSPEKMQPLREAIGEIQFRRQYFQTVPIATIQATLR
jgi:single-stranded-DNA-specific exonuclease